MLLYMLKECHISIMRAQLLINMIITWVSKICELVPYTDINPLLRRQLILLNVLIYDSQAVCCVLLEKLPSLYTAQVPKKVLTMSSKLNEKGLIQVI